jgi:hypothetical protein
MVVFLILSFREILEDLLRAEMDALRRYTG